MYLGGKWTFPIDQAKVVTMYVDCYYNFVMDSDHSMIVNDIPCISLGHGFQDEVAKHGYFGTNLIIDDLSRISGWEQGSVLVGNKAFKRDPVTLEVVGMAF